VKTLHFVSSIFAVSCMALTRMKNTGHQVTRPMPPAEELFHSIALNNMWRMQIWSYNVKNVKCGGFYIPRGNLVSVHIVYKV